VNELTWIPRFSDWLVARAPGRSPTVLRVLLTYFGLGVMLLSMAFAVPISTNARGAAPGTVALLQLGLLATFIAGALCFLRVGAEMGARILGGVVAGSFGLSLVTLSVSLPANASDPFATFLPTYLVSAIAVGFLARRKGFR
jgi:hypothetical protein